MPTKHEVNIKAPEVEVTWSTDVSKAKRCNSLTDSPCETSSSTSTVDSEELEFGRCKSKGTMTTDMPQSSEANVPNVSDKVVTLNNKNSPVSKSENHKNNNISVYPYVEAPNKLQSNKKQIHHQKKKKEKVSNEKTCSVDLSATTSVAEKGPTHGLVDMQQLLDRTVIQEPVRLTYTKDNGDHSLRLANSSVVKFYTTANCLHSLTESGESRLSKISVPLSTNERKLNIQTPSRIAEKSILSRDELENENLRKMIDDSYKMAQGCSRWIRSFHESLVDGNPAVFVNKFNCILRILRKSDDRERYKKMSDQQFREHVMLGILRRFMDEVEQTTVFHHLAATRNVDKPCSKRNHGSCRLIRLILSLLSWEDVRLFLRVKTKRTGKTALHMAAITGEQCQMEALMNFDVAPDILDCSGRAPLHYAVMRNSLDIVKLLLWYGADISLKERECTPVQLASLNPDTLDVANFLESRRIALQALFMQWIQCFVRGVWSPLYAISDLHFLRLSKEGDSHNGEQATVERSVRSVALNMRVLLPRDRTSNKAPLPLLFIVPTFYRSDDQMFAAENPQLFRASLRSIKTDDIIKLIPAKPLLKGGLLPPTPLDPAFTNPHNGFFYVFQLPRHMIPGSYVVHFSVDLREFGPQAKHVLLACQSIACGSPDAKLAELLRSKPNKPKSD